MLEVCINIVCQFIMFYMGFAAVKTLIETDKKINYIQVTILLLLGAIVSTCIYQVEYKSIYTILMYLINIIIYKIIWDKVKEVNKELTSYKAIKKLEIKHDDFVKTTTMKIKRYEEIKKDK